MRRAGLAAVLVAFIMGIGGAAAGTADIRCVQQGLQNGGFDPNGVDGVIGPGTAAAAAAYLADNPGSGLPALAPATAASWCGAFRSSSGGLPSRLPIQGLQGVGLNSAALWSGGSAQSPHNPGGFLDHFRPLEKYGFSHVVLVSCIDWIIDLPCKKRFQNRHGMIESVRLLLDNTALHVTLSFKAYEQRTIDGRDVSTFQKRLAAERSVQDDFAAAWGDFAETFRKVPRERLSFALLNEPEFRDPKPTAAQRNAWQDIASRAIEAIRAVSPDRVIIAEGIGKSKFNERLGKNDPRYRYRSPDDLIQPLPYADIVYGFHSYAPRAFLDQALNKVGFFGRRYTKQHRAVVRDDAKRAMDWANRHDVPVMITETGCVGYVEGLEGPSGPEECGKYAADVHDLFVQNDIPVVWWGLEKERTIYVKQRSDCSAAKQKYCDLWMPATRQPDHFLFQGFRLHLP